MDYLLLADRYGLATVFAVAFFGKVRTRSGFRQFVTSIQRLAVLPRRPAAAVALAVVVGEGGGALLLAIPGTARPGFALATGLIVVFIAVVVRGTIGGATAECRCFGKAAVMGMAMVFRNVILLAAALWGLLAGAAMWPGEPLYAAVALIAGCCAAVAFIRYYDVAVRRVVGWIPASGTAPAPDGPKVDRHGGASGDRGMDTR